MRERERGWRGFLGRRGRGVRKVSFYQVSVWVKGEVGVMRRVILGQRGE